MTAVAELLSLGGRGERLLHSNTCRLTSDSSTGSSGSEAKIEIFRFGAEYRPLPESVSRKQLQQILKGAESRLLRFRPIALAMWELTSLSDAVA